MKSKKVMLVILSLVMVFIMAACSTVNNTTNSGGENKVTDPSNSNNEASGETENSKDAGPKSLVVLNDGALNLGAGTADEAIARTKKELEKKETGNDGLFQLEWVSFINEKMKEEGIELIYEDWGWAEPLIQKQTTAFLAGEGADVIIGETQSPGFAAQGVLEPFPDWLAMEISGNIVDGAWKPMEFNGQIYGVAAQPGVNSLYWNKSLLSKAGLDPNTPPKTWNELIDMSRQIADAGNKKFYAGGIYAGPNFGGILRYGALLMINNGGFVDENNKPIFNNPNNVAPFELLRELGKYNDKGTIVAKEEGPFWDAFTKGQLAFVIDGPWRGQICKDLKMDCGVAPIPLSEGGQPGNVTIGAAFMSVPKYSKNKEAAFKYIQAAISNESIKIVEKYGVRPVIRKEIGESDQYRLNNPGLYQVYEGLKGNVQGLPTYSKNDSKVWQAFEEAMVKAVLTDTPIQDLLDDAQKKAENLTQ